MRKLLRNTIIAIATILIVAIAIYTIRENKADKQYILQNSESLIGLSLDDIFLSNLSVLLPKTIERTRDSTKSDKLFNKIWNSGLAIPAKLYFTTLQGSTSKLYTIQKIRNWENWITTLHQFDQKIDTLADSYYFFKFDKNIAIVFDREHILFELAIGQQTDSEILRQLLKNKERWQMVKNITSSKLTSGLKTEHLFYYHFKKEHFLGGQIVNKELALEGIYKSQHNLADMNSIRRIDEKSNALIFWSSLYWDEMPRLAPFFEKFLNINTEQIAQSYKNYMDFVIKTKTVVQKDTVISYDYDENFNSIAKEEVQKTQVPLIEFTLKGEKEFLQTIPQEIFYNFYKTSKGQFQLHSTEQGTLKTLKFEQNKMPFYFYTDFTLWPTISRVGAIAYLVQEKVKIEIQTSVKSKKELKIKAKIDFKGN